LIEDAILDLKVIDDGKSDSVVFDDLKPEDMLKLA
jgi:tetratricopeptide (TPR) repeat protein